MDLVVLKMKKIIISMFALLLLINFISAGSQFYMTKNDLGDKIIQNRITFCYDKRMSVVLGDISDNVQGDNFYESYFLYSVYVKKWNQDNPNYMIDYCNMSVYQSSRITNYTSIFYSYFTQADSDLSNLKYFLRMKDGDCVIAEQQCKYNLYANVSNLDIPIDMQLVTSTWECKACQRYENSILSRSIDKTNAINTNTISVSTFIKNLILLNFEILLMIFWVFMILLLFVSVGLIFLIFWWMYFYIKEISK